MRTDNEENSKEKFLHTQGPVRKEFDKNDDETACGFWFSKCEKLQW
jgi:hypothetical protein